MLCVCDLGVHACLCALRARACVRACACMHMYVWSSLCLNQNVQGPLAPTVMKLNCNDDNLYLGIPEDVAVAEDPATLHSGKKVSDVSGVGCCCCCCCCCCIV